jgi:hypothetical protein
MRVQYRFNVCNAPHWFILKNARRNYILLLSSGARVLSPYACPPSHEKWCLYYCIRLAVTRIMCKKSNPYVLEKSEHARNFATVMSFLNFCFMSYPYLPDPSFLFIFLPLYFFYNFMCNWQSIFFYYVHFCGTVHKSRVIVNVSLVDLMTC